MVRKDEKGEEIIQKSILHSKQSLALLFFKEELEELNLIIQKSWFLGAWRNGIFTPYSWWADGGIGRRTGFRCQREQSHESSTLSIRTK